MNEKLLREVVKIDEEKCTGCGDCIPACPEGALQIIDGKARLISDLYCDGLGACIGECPVDAITVEKRAAEPYNEAAAMGNIVKKGPNTIRAHLEHLIDHGEEKLLEEALDFLEEKSLDNPLDPVNKKEENSMQNSLKGGCPGSRSISFERTGNENPEATDEIASRLGQWPVQLHLVPPTAPYFQNSEVVLSADCVAYSFADFHRRFLEGKSLAIACPKLDQGQEQYLNKLKAMIDGAEIDTLTVLTMEVPCCRGLLRLAQKAISEAERNIPLKSIKITVQGELLAEEWISVA